MGGGNVLGDGAIVTGPYYNPYDNQYYYYYYYPYSVATTPTRRWPR